MLIDRMKRTFADRCRKNSAYSLRAFARSLNMDSSTVSALMSGKRPLTIKTAKKIVDGLHITNPVEAQELIVGTFADDHAKKANVDYTEMALEAAEAISSWEHFAILSVLELDGIKATDRAIAERLNIPIGIAWECLERLEKMNLIRRGKAGWELTGRNFATPSQVPSGAIREGHRQFILKAIDALESVPVTEREVSGITMAISKSRLNDAKKMIQDFRRRLSMLLEDGKRDSVYRLNIQLYPLIQEKKS